MRERIPQEAGLPLPLERWAREAARNGTLRQPMLRRPLAAVEGDTPESRAVREALRLMGCRLETRWRVGIPAFWADGKGLHAQDERGARWDEGQILTLLTLIEMENGRGAVALPPRASAAMELVAAGYGGRVLRLEHDGEEARQLYDSQPWLWSAPHGAVRICSRMGVSGQRLDTLMSKTPRFHAWRREVALSGSGERLLDRLARERGAQVEGSSLRLHTGDGWLYLEPLRNAGFGIRAEGPDLEAAAELCDFYAAHILELDRQGDA